MWQHVAALILPYTFEQKKQLSPRFFGYIRRIERCDGCHCRRCIMGYSLCEAFPEA
jgi:hypothetical protein